MTLVGIIGAGTMGAGIAQVALLGGDTVRLHDVDPSAVDGALERIRAGLRRSAERLEVQPSDVVTLVDGHLARLEPAPKLDDLAPVDLAIEAVVEALEPKRELVRRLGSIVSPDAIVATNTSALSVAAIARASRRPERVLGLHFFNPVPVMRLVEVVVPAGVSPAIVDAAAAAVERWGKVPIRCADTPGFIVNRVHRPFTIQALRMLEAGEASIESIDTALREAGFPMGPFELMDLSGIDVNLAAATAIWEGLGRPDRFRPSPIQERLVAEGHLGRKTGRGFYAYVDGRRAGVAFEEPGTGKARVEPTEIREWILTSIAAEAKLAAQAGVASPADIGRALRLGAGHPEPPLG